MFNLTRFKQALQTPLGDLFFFLVVSTVTFALFYLYFWIRFKKNKELMFRHHSVFNKCEKQIEAGQLSGKPRSHLFGKEQLIALNDGRFAQSITTYPEICTPNFIRNFYDYHSQLKQSSIRAFPDNILENHNNLLVNIETQYTHSDGKSLISLSNYLLDRSLSLSEKELILVDIAHMLEALHEMSSFEGKTLYYGLLLPSNIYLCQNMMKQITHVYLSLHGYTFSLGANLSNKWIKYLLDDRIVVDSSLQKEMQRFSFMLAPEQKELKRWSEVNELVDNYSFASLAVFIFTESGFSSVQAIDWSKVPDKWQSFLQECLNPNPQKRPSNFNELQEYFNSPELSLTQPEMSQIEIKGTKDSSEPTGSLKDIFEHVSNVKSKLEDFSDKWHEGFEAIRNKNWDGATSIFNGIMKVDDQAFNAHLGLALMFYHQGIGDKAKFHYEKAKQLDSKRISCFHRLIVFDI